MKALDVKTKIDSYQYLKIAAFRKNIRTTTPHKHNSYVEFVFLSSGSGTHTIDGKTYRVTPPVMFTIRKEQVHHWELTDEPDGYVLILKKQYVENRRDMTLRDLQASVIANPYDQVGPSNNFAKLVGLLLASWNPPLPHQVDEIDELLKPRLSSVLRYSYLRKRPTSID